MLNVNNSVLSGRAVADAELKTANSSQVCTFRIVHNKRVKKRDGNYEEKPMYIDCEAWGERAEYASKYVKKGLNVMVISELEQDEWKSPEGQNRSKHKLYVTKLQVERPKNAEGQEEGQAERPAPQSNTQRTQKKKSEPVEQEAGNDLPF